MKYLLILAFFLPFASLPAQDASAVLGPFEHYWQFYFSFGGGVSFLNGFPDEVYQDGHSNVQLGFMVEKTISPRFSAFSGIELELLNYSFDGELAEGNGQPLRIVPAADGVKYARIVQRNLTVPLQLRGYLRPNAGKGSKNAYLQGGLRFSLPGSTEYTFRANQEKQAQDLEDLAPSLLVSAELMIGFKGDFFERFDLLNASSLGVIYQATPLLEEGSAIHPVHLTWRFLF